MVHILNQISNQLRNTSDPVPKFNHDFTLMSVGCLTLSLGLAVLVGALAMSFKIWLWDRAHNWGTVHNPEEQARNRELYAKYSRHIPVLFGLLPFLAQVSVASFWMGAGFARDPFIGNLVLGLLYLGTLGYLVTRSNFQIKGRKPTEFRSKSSPHEAALGPEIVYVDISNCLFKHTSMAPKNFPIFIQLFSLPIEHPRLRIRFLEPWSQLSSLLPSVLMDIYSRSRFNILPALRLCLVLSGQGQSEQPWMSKEAKRAYSTIKTSNPLQNLYLHLLLSQFHARFEDTDHWQDACRILRDLEYSKEHTSELLWLVDSIQLYTLGIKGDFTTRIVEFLRGVVVYLAKCPGDENNGDLLRTAAIMAAEWLISLQSSDNGNPPWKYILSRQGVHSGKTDQKAFVLVENRGLSLSERLQRSINLYLDLLRTDSSSDFVIRTLLISIMAIESFAAEKEGKSISDAVPCIQKGDLRCSLEGLWDLWEGGFNHSDLLRFMLTLVVPTGVQGTQGSMAILLLNEYLQQINGSPAQITEKAFRFVSATLEHSLTAGTTKDKLDLQLPDVRSLNPWLSLHIDNILGCRSTPCVDDLERMITLDSRVKAVVARKRLNLYLSSNAEPEPDILALLVQSDDPEISLEAFGQGVNLLESPLTDKSDSRNPGYARPFAFALLEQDKRSHLISCFFDPQQSTSMCQTVWIMLTEDLFPRWELLPADWRHDIATALVAATEWMEKSQKILVKEVKRQHGIRASGKAKQLIGATVLALVNYGDTEHHWKRKVPLGARDERFQERLDACARVYLQLYATAVEEIGERAKTHIQHIVNFLVDIPDVLNNRDAIKRIQRVLGISRRMETHREFAR